MAPRPLCALSLPLARAVASLAPDQPVTPTPHALFASDAATAAELRTRVTSLEAAVAELQALLAGANRSAQGLVFSGMNVQIVNGTGATGGSTQWLGVTDLHPGAYWRSLTDKQIVVYRKANDDNADKIRVRIWVIK